MLHGLKNALMLTYRAWKENIFVHQFVRHKTKEGLYFAVTPYVEDGPYPDTMFIIRPVGHTETFVITAEQFNEMVEPCSPYEAIHNKK